MNSKSVSQQLPPLSLPRRPFSQKLEEGTDFLNLFLTVEKECETCFLFESLQSDHPNSRYDMIGFIPKMVFRGSSGILSWSLGGGECYEMPSVNPYEVLAQWMPQNIITRNYAGGLIGYLSYDSVGFFEPTLKLRSHPQFDQLIFGLYTDGLVYDKMTGESFYFYYEESRLKQVEEWIKKSRKKEGSLNIQITGRSCSKDEHKEAVQQTLEEIRLGNTFQCQIGLQENYEWKGDLTSFYLRLREINPSPHMLYVKFEKKILIGSSPELLFHLHQGEMQSFPLAGTSVRGKDRIEDLRLARKLLNDPKEIAEHNMLVDLHRNDLGKVARFGTVRVRHLMDTKKFSHVQHISSEVAGMISKHHDMFSGLASSFPAGTLSGAPKIESMKIIERLESLPRGPYGGAVGCFGFNGDCTFAIPIRTLFIHENTAFTRASGGIVYDSTPEGEYEEIERKLAAVRKSLEPFLGK